MKLLTIMYTEGKESMEKFLNKFNNLSCKAMSAWCKLKDDLTTSLLLLSLPDWYKMVVTTIETLADNKFTTDCVRRRLLDD